MAKYIFTLITAFMTLLLSASVVEKLADGGLKISNNNYQVELLNPNCHDENIVGCRFIRAGWLKSLKLHRSKESLIKTQTVYNYHVTYGLTFAFSPSLRIGEIENKCSKYLNIGVGVVERDKTKGWIFDRIVKSFDWKYKINHNEQFIQIEYLQDSGKAINGYAWHLTQNVEFLENSIVFRQSLKNNGNKILIQETYPHPFFNAVKGKAKCKFILPCIEKNKLNLAPLTVGDFKPGLIINGGKLALNCRWVAALNLADNNVYCRISTKEKLSKTQFWRNVEGCFAVEPFIELKIPPGEQRSWEWTIDFGYAPMPEKIKK